MDASAGARRGSVVVAYALFVLVGLATGASAILLPAQMADYGVDRASIGLTFFTFSAGFVLASMATGPLIHRYGTRLALVAGGGAAFLVSAVYQVSRPPFVAFIAVQLAAGFAIGMLESVLNAHLAALPRATTLLNRLHAFFGVGALIGPVAAAWIVQDDPARWTLVLAALVAVGVPGFVAAWLTLPSRSADPLAHQPSAGDSSGARASLALLPAALRSRAVLLASTVLALYVGLEIGVGNWGAAYLVDARSVATLTAASTVSGYWAGLTVGRFVLTPIAGKLGMSTVGLLTTCFGGVIAASALVWLVPVGALAPVGFVLLGFFLGPIFPTTMAVAPELIEPRLAPTAMGVMNAGGVVGGSALPWLEGAAGQAIGVWTLLPIVVLLGVAQLLVWWRLAAGMAPASLARQRIGAVAPQQTAG
jgi:fucose permease